MLRCSCVRVAYCVWIMCLIVSGISDRILLELTLLQCKVSFTCEHFSCPSKSSSSKPRVRTDIFPRLCLRSDSTGTRDVLCFESEHPLSISSLVRTLRLCLTAVKDGPHPMTSWRLSLSEKWEHLSTNPSIR